MGSKHCRLYDENLVHNIMISTGLSIFEYIRDNKFADTEEICEFLELNASSIIEDTIAQMNTSEEASGQSGEEDRQESEDWPFPDSGLED